MTGKKFGNTALLGSALLTSFVPMLCCWGPALLLGVAGVSGASSYFTWVAPVRPYLFTVAFLSLVWAFYKAYKPSKQDEQACPNCKAPERKSKFRKISLWLVAVFVFSMFTIHYFI